MISEFSIAKALRDKADIVATAIPVTLTGADVGFKPKPDQTYVEERVGYGPTNSVGISDSSSDLQIGIYQLSTFTPKTEPKWNGLDITDKLALGFPKGTELIHNSQMVRIKESSLTPMMQNDTHLIHVLTVTYSVIN